MGRSWGGEGRIQADVSGRFSRRMEWTRDKGSWQTVSSIIPSNDDDASPTAYVCLFAECTSMALKSCTKTESYT